MAFDPKTNPADSVYLSQLIANILAKLQERVESQQGTLSFDGKDYKFFGMGDYVRMYVNWYKREMNDIYGKIGGHDKVTKYDWITAKLIAWVQKPDSDAKSKDILKELVEYCSQPNAEPQNPTAFTKKLDEIFKTLRKEVIARIMPGVEKEIDDIMLPVIWDALIKHVERQEAMAANFWLSSDEWSGIVLESAQSMKAEGQAPSST